MTTRRILLVCLMMLLFIEAGILLVARLTRRVRNPLTSYAEAVHASCRNEGYTPACYDREIPRLMDHISMEEAFDVARLVQEKDPKYMYCHVLGHNLSYRETGKDLSKWKDVVARCPTNFCNNGCQHGAIMRRFNAESLTDKQIIEVKPDLMDVCEPRGGWNPTEVERSMCYHALGHLAMFITRADIGKSVDLCRDIGIKADGRSYTETCTQGVLMSVYQPLEPEDYTLVKGLTPTKEGVKNFCSRFTGDTWVACHNESWPLFMEDIKSPGGLMKFCGYTKESRPQAACVSTAMNILTVLMVVDRNNDLTKLRDYCNGLPSPFNGQCYANTAFRLVQIDPRYVPTARAICEAADREGLGQACYPYLLQHVTHSFHPKSTEARIFCDGFKEPWKTECRKMM